MYADGGGTGGGGGSPRPQRKARRTTISAKPRPRPAPSYNVQSYSPPPRPVARSNSSGSYTSFSSGRSGGGGGGGRARSMNPPGPGRIGGVGSKKAPAPKPEPKAPGVGKFLKSDNIYQQSLAELRKTLEQFKTQNVQGRGDVKEAFQTAMERMGMEREDALKALEADFASRGLLNSGLYGESVSDYNTQYGDRTSDLTKDRDTQIRNARQEFSNYRSLHKSKKGDLKMDAIRRRAEKYGLKS